MALNGHVQFKMNGHFHSYVSLPKAEANHTPSPARGMPHSCASCEVKEVRRIKAVTCAGNMAINGGMAGGWGIEMQNNANDLKITIEHEHTLGLK